ncbi:MAG TPA: outer membrane beta-barrel protein [Thermoanaerobaculia bacterium]|jgi:opacity protein-like surface antigen|nr:outer membrane beta-barrel protein [Thermoanaerobaculia bacterium]
MNKLAGFLSAVLVALGAPAVFAQGTRPVQFGLSGGADFPVADQRDVYKTGWNGTALLAFNFGTSPVGLRVDGSYHELKTKSNAFFLGSGKTRIIDGTLDLVVGPRNLAVEPYLIGGGGAYDLRFRGQDITTGNAFSQSTTRFGWNVGGGLAFPLRAGSGSRIFVEARYTSISVSVDRFSNSIHTGGTRFTFVPVNVGILF